MTYTYEHKGYILQQTTYNWHYMIFDKIGNLRMHASCKKKLSKKEAVNIIEAYLYMAEHKEEE